MVRIGFCERHRCVTRDGCGACLFEAFGTPRWLAVALDLLIPLATIATIIGGALYFAYNVLVAYAQMKAGR